MVGDVITVIGVSICVCQPPLLKRWPFSEDHTSMSRVPQGGAQSGSIVMIHPVWLSICDENWRPRGGHRWMPLLAVGNHSGTMFFVPYGPRYAEVHRDEPNRPNLAAGCWRILCDAVLLVELYTTEGSEVVPFLCVVWIETATPVPTCCHAAGFGNAIATCAPSPFCPLTVVTVKWACVAGASVDCVDCDSGAQFKCRPL